MRRTQAPVDAPKEAFWHQKWPCVLGIGANVEDRRRPLELKWRREAALLGSDLGQIFSAKGLDGVVGKWGGEVKFGQNQASALQSLMI